MKLTKDMLDFEKYDYFAGSTFSGKDPVDVFHAGAWVSPVDGACMYELARAFKPKPLAKEGPRMSRTYDPSGGEPVKLGQCTLEMFTDKAIQVTSAKGLKHWIPMSAIHDDSEIYGRDIDGKQQARGSDGVLVVKRWLARERGWTKE